MHGYDVHAEIVEQSDVEAHLGSALSQLAFLPQPQLPVPQCTRAPCEEQSRSRDGECGVSCEGADDFR